GLLIGQYSNSSYIINRDSSNMYFWTGGQERVRLDSAGNLLVGRSSDSGLGKLQVYGGADIAGGDVYLARDTGNVLVGKTATSQTTAGTVLYSNGQAYSTASGTQASVLTRLSSDGPIQIFYKDSSEVGRIGNYGGLALDVGKGTTAVLRFRDSLNAIYPAAGIAGGTSDGVTSLGISSGRFNNFYLSGGIYIGGTGGANRFDDYEEGAWTPVIGGGTYTYSYRRGHYVKIGNMVYAHVGLKINTATSVSASTASITGLPFTGANYGGYQEPMSRIDAGGIFVTSNLGTNLSFYLSSGTAVMYGRTTATNADSPIAASSVWQNGTFIKLTMIYTVS
ncbi:hypothetical protein N9H13_01585, partial [bacterium]|nr:hypothetical protein [bacterium]